MLSAISFRGCRRFSLNGRTMATATKTRPKTKPKRKRESPARVLGTPVVATPAPTAVATKLETLYLITGEDLEILIGNEGDWVRNMVKDDKDNGPLAYRHYDDDKQVWATWAVLQTDGTVKPMSFPDPSEYGMTPPELYTKAATFKSIISQIVQILGEEKETVWEKMMKPATVITAIVAILVVLAIFVIGAQG